MYNKLIYGKNSTENIVNIEVEDDKATLFKEINGKIETEVVSNKFWLLTGNPRDRGWAKLKGDLYFKYGKQFSNRNEFQKHTNFLRKSNDFYTIYDGKESLMTKDGYTYFKGMKPEDVSVLSFDIESTGLYQNDDSKVLLISNTFECKNKGTINKLFSYDQFESQAHMIASWCNWVREINPSLIIGHNVYSYDIPYLDYIAKREGLDGLKLGRDGSYVRIGKMPSKFRIDGNRDQEYNKIRCYGRDVIDTMFLAIKYDIATKKYESYGLKSIIKTEGLEREDRVHYDSSKIRFNYEIPEEWEKIKAYCEHDATDALNLFKLMAPPFFYMTQSIPKSFQQVIESATGSQINALMVRSYLQEGYSLPRASISKKFEGAISFGNPGIYRNTYKTDVTSLYPSIILQCSVYDEDKDPQKNFLTIVETLTNERIKNKKLAKTSKYYDDMQSAQKIVINSCYGFLATEGLLFNSPDAAEFITKTGRDVLQIALDWAEKKQAVIVNADTDSISFAKKDQSVITEEERLELLDDLNRQFPDKIKFEDDGYYPAFIVLKAKNYVMYDGEKIKYKGSALKASNKEIALKEFQRQIIDSIIKDQQNYTDIYYRYLKEATNITDITRWASKKTISHKTLTSERKNETNIKDIIRDTEYVEGDKIYAFYKDSETLELVEKFDGTYDKTRLYKKLYDTSKVFETILPTNELFINYSLKKNQKLLEQVLTSVNNQDIIVQ